MTRTMDYIVAIFILAFAVFFVMRRIFKAFKRQGIPCCSGEVKGCGPCSPAEMCMKDDEP